MRTIIDTDITHHSAEPVAMLFGGLVVVTDTPQRRMRVEG